MTKVNDMSNQVNALRELLNYLPRLNSDMLAVIRDRCNRIIYERQKELGEAVKTDK